MRIISLSNLYPPVGNGGYEQWCQEVTEGLRSRGHAVHVITGRTHRERVPADEPFDISRRLHMEMDFGSRDHSLHFFTDRQQREQENLAFLEHSILDFRPDIFLVWGMWNLPRSLPALAERMLPGRVVYYLADYWPTLPSQHVFYWQAPAKSAVAWLPKTLLKPLALAILRRENHSTLQFQRGIFPSWFLLQEYQRRGVPVREPVVIPGAVDTRPFLSLPPGYQHTSNGNKLSLLYAGRLSPEKGVETAVQAMQELVLNRGCKDVHLTIAGSGQRAYTNRLHQAVQQAGLGNMVTFSGMLPKKAMPELYEKHDVFLFPSIWQEPFGRVLVEALASGMVVVGAATGGAAEILSNQENALTFTPGDPDSLADQIELLLEQPGLRRRLAEKGRQVAVSQFDLSRMVNDIEAYLVSIINH